MVTNVTSLTGNGLKDWLIQRVTAVIVAVYFVYLATFLSIEGSISFQQWHSLFHTPWFSIASALAMISISLHAWIGIWTVTTDYIKATAVRIIVQMLVAIWLIAQFIWVLMIIWGQ